MSNAKTRKLVDTSIFNGVIEFVGHDDETYRYINGRVYKMTYSGDFVIFAAYDSKTQGKANPNRIYAYVNRDN